MTASKTRQAGSKLKQEMETALEDRIKQAGAAADAARARLEAALDEEEKGAARAELASAEGDFARATEDLETARKAGSVAELIGKDAPGDGRVVVTVIGPARGRRRAGRQFDATPRTIAVTPAELALIEGDGELAVTPGAIADLDAPAGPAARPPVEAFLDGETVRPVKVLGPARGRRRAGYHFGPQATTIEPTRAQLELILSDAELSAAPA